MSIYGQSKQARIYLLSHVDIFRLVHPCVLTTTDRIVLNGFLPH